MTAPTRPTDGSCSRWLGAAYCGARETRYFAAGHRCADHSPCALAGQPELPGGPGIPAYQKEVAA